MRRRVRILLLVGLLAGVLLTSTGCLFNLFQTARMLGAGNTAFTIGTGLMDPIQNGQADWSLTPQARFAVGVTDGIDFGLQTGAFVPLSTGDFGWLGLKGDFKFSILDDPETFSLAMGFGGGYGAEFLNWALFGTVLFDVNATIPIFLVYQPTIPLQAGTFTVWHHLAGGLRLTLSDSAAILLVIDYRSQLPGALFSFGIAIEMGF